jgi:hypothetical protein
MTTDVEDILKAARSLPPHEQLEVMQGLAQSLRMVLSPLASASAAFKANRSLAELIAEQKVPVVSDIQALAMPDWPEDETADDVIAYVRGQRAADREH